MLHSPASSCSRRREKFAGFSQISRPFSTFVIHIHKIRPARSEAGMLTDDHDTPSHRVRVPIDSYT